MKKTELKAGKGIHMNDSNTDKFVLQNEKLSLLCSMEVKKAKETNWSDINI